VSSPSVATVPSGPAALTGASLWSAAVAVALANFLAGLDMSIANVSVPNISGGLGVSTSQGTWVITSYAVAEAITVPLTGWLVERFGMVRVFVSAIIGFGICSALCGLAPSLGFLVLFRVLQGLAGGPLMPLSQTVMMKIFPRKLQSVGTAIWAMTTIMGPILGPILGGTLCDNLGWPAIFWVNVPIALVCGPIVLRKIGAYETATRQVRVDGVGLGLLVLWVGALQTVVDLGKEYDWFASPMIVGLALVAVIAFAAFLIWELTEREPIVALKVFRHRGFSTLMITMALTFGAFFAANVLTPLWLQSNMGYTATWAGYANATFGLSALIAAPLASRLASRPDTRMPVFAGVLFIALIALLRSDGNSQMTFWQVSFWVFLMGVGLPFFFLPLSSAALGSVEPQEVTSAAGLMNFIRTLAGAVGTSIINTAWDNSTSRNHAELAGILNDASGAAAGLTHGGLSQAQAVSSIDQIVTDQAIMLATNHVFLGCAVALAIAACCIWLSPKPKHVADTSGLH
jgi:MFS transporter, DHA2 family, multidrug resistance protein